MKPASVRAFLRFLSEDGVIRQKVLSMGIAVKVPDSLPRAIAPKDVRELLSVVDGTRNRAMVLMLFPCKNGDECLVDR